MTGAETAGVMVPAAVRERAVLVSLAVGAEERRELLAAGELIEVAGAEATGAVLVGAAVEGADPPEHVFEPTASLWPPGSAVHRSGRQFCMIWPSARVAQRG